MSAAIIGRPKSKNPKTIEVKARIDKELNDKLVKYCEENKLTRTDVVRRGIEMVIKNRTSCSVERLRCSIFG